MGVEPDLVDGGDEGVEEGGTEIDEGVGGDEGGGDGGFPLRSVILAERVECQQWQHSPRNPSPNSHLHLDYRLFCFNFVLNFNANSANNFVFFGLG